MVKALFLFSALASAGGFDEADRLYFSRNEAGQLEAAERLLREKAASASSDAQALWRLGRVLVKSGERRSSSKEKLTLFAEAQAILERSALLDDKNAEAHFWAGIALGRVGQTRGILRSLFMIAPMKKRMARVLELDPRHSGAHHVLGEMFRQLPAFAGGSKKRAVEELETAVALGPDWTSHYPALAEAYRDAGRKDDALRILKALESVERPADPAEAAQHRELARLLAVEIGG